MLKEYLDILDMNEDIKNVEDITRLMQAHLNIFPFSSAKVLLKYEISLDIKDIFASIVLQKKGGYCFEHNKLFYEVLKALGFKVEFFLARVINNTKNIVPLTHRITVLYIRSEKYLIDVGFGFRTPIIAVKFSLQKQYSHLGTSYFIKKEDDSYSMVLSDEKEDFVATSFTLDKYHEADCILGHFYSSRYEKAAFVNNLVVSLIKKDRMYSLVNNRYEIKYTNGRKYKKEIIIINSYIQFESILDKDLNLHLENKEIKYLYDRFINV